VNEEVNSSNLMKKMCCFVVKRDLCEFACIKLPHVELTRVRIFPFLPLDTSSNLSQRLQPKRHVDLQDGVVNPKNVLLITRPNMTRN